jgi:hypothetical protein
VRQAAAIIALLASAMSAGAEVYMPECGDPGVGVYDVAWHGGGYVFFAGGQYDAGETLLVLDDCPKQRRLTMQIFDDDKIDKPRGGALFDAVDKAVRSQQSYTMRQIEAIARKAGAKTVFGPASFTSCACEKYGAVGP